MKRTMLVAALALAAFPSFAAVQYEYTQKNTAEDSATPSSDLTARAIVDEGRSRVDFISGNVYPPGTYVVSPDGARLFFIDPTKKWYTEFNAAGAVSALGATNIKIGNLRSNMAKLGDRPVIAGIETDHYQLTIDYDVTVVIHAIPMKQSVHTVIDSWTTPRFGGIRHALASGVRTGNAELDKMLDIESNKVQGFPMRQTVSIRTTLENRNVNSQLKVQPTRTISREMRVMSVRELASNPALFTIPAGFTRADNPEVPRAATQVLNFDPPSK